MCIKIIHVKASSVENKNKNKILRISFDKVEELNGEKVVVFVSSQGRNKAISKEAVQLLYPFHVGLCFLDGGYCHLP